MKRVYLLICSLFCLGIGITSAQTTRNNDAPCPFNICTTYSETISASVTNAGCNGGTDGVIIATFGPNAPFTYSWSTGTNGITNSSTDTLSGLSAGTYSVVVGTNLYLAGCWDCTPTASVTVTISQTAALTATPYSVNATSGCNGVAAITVSGINAPYTYSWSPGGQTTDTIMGQCAGSYTCVITDSTGCSATSYVTVNSGVTGVNSISNLSAINIYPDPNNGYFTVTGIKQWQVIELFDYLGQRLSRVMVNNPTMYIDISTKTNGIYLMRIINNDGSLAAQRKILKIQ